MKNFYLSTVKFLIFFLAVMFIGKYNSAQCPWGYVPDGVAFDTTIATPAGINSMQIKFPKFDPQEGMVTCVRLCISITGVVDFVSVENNSASPQTADVYYVRSDQLSGPALSTPLTNNINYHYGPYSLGPTDGMLGSGPDYVSIANDTLLNSVSVCRTISDSADLSQFYGPANDSVTYTYDISAFTNVSCTGGNYNSTVATSALVNFRFEYCFCPAWVLPLNVRQFNVNKQSGDKAELSWTGFDDNSNYRYEIEVSRNGRNFTHVGVVQKNAAGTNPYKFVYATGRENSGMHFFRIKQVYSNGYSLFSEIRSVELEKSTTPGFIIYPNPSTGIVGIKFDNNYFGKYSVLITNAQGQAVLKKEIEVNGPAFRQIGTLQSGVYWLRLTDVTSHLSCVNQLFIK